MWLQAISSLQFEMFYVNFDIRSSLSLCSFELVLFLTYYRNVLRYEIRFEISLKISSKKLRQQLLRLTVIVCVRGVKESKLLNKGSKQ